MKWSKHIGPDHKSAAGRMNTENETETRSVFSDLSSTSSAWHSTEDEASPITLGERPFTEGSTFASTSTHWDPSPSSGASTETLMVATAGVPPSNALRSTPKAFGPRGIVASLLSFILAAALITAATMATRKVVHEKQPPVEPLVAKKQKPPKPKPKLTLDLTKDEEISFPKRPEGAYSYFGPAPDIKVSSDQQSIQRYEAALGAASVQLSQAWNSASSIVQEAFCKHFMPRLKEGVTVPAPLAMFERHAEALRSMSIGEQSSTTEKRNYVARLLLVTSVLHAASARISSLTELETFCKNTGMGSVLLGIKAVPLPSAEQLSSIGKGEEANTTKVSYSRFLDLVQDCHAPDKSSGARSNQGIPEVLAMRLVNVLKCEMLHEQHNTRVTKAFDMLLDALGRESPSHKASLVNRSGFLMSPGNRPFSTPAFEFALAELGKQNKDHAVSPRDIASWSHSWTVHGVLSILQWLEAKECQWLDNKRNDKEEATQVFQELWIGTHVPAHDLYSLAVALL
ncbi:uncharacterized protein LOC34617659 [Cyclospora cayetanensis]|uniref:Uncharacterized protein LOC34617659 n=1 Tax=Cyclospora cayetanensis TaxID=88456 RepID=A0A6P5WCT1_9EIME|nr:uncharacterized protein LOC34617659 [Cyclospora cayetanensis]